MNHPTIPSKKQGMTLRFHLFALAGSILYTIILSLITRGYIEIRFFMISFVLMMSQVEFFAWIGTKVFKTLVYNSVKEFVRKVISRLIIFYLFVVLVAGILFVIVSAMVSMQQGVSLDLFFKQLPEKELRGFIIGSSFGLLTGTVIYFFIELITVIKREQSLNEEKLCYQYETLKNQMNPHFLFNSLNTLSSIIYQDTKLADRFIVKLSSIYRYILDQQDNKMVNLENELTFVRDYFYLQQLRDNDRIHLDIDIETPTRYLILPVSLQLLVENALKHNAATDDKPLKIRISISGVDHILVENNLQPRQQINGSFKIGLKNLSERVRILTGKELLIEQNNERFCVKVPITRI